MFFVLFAVDLLSDQISIPAGSLISLGAAERILCVQNSFP